MIPKKSAKQALLLGVMMTVPGGSPKLRILFKSRRRGSRGLRSKPWSRVMEDGLSRISHSIDCLVLNLWSDGDSSFCAHSSFCCPA